MKTKITKTTIVIVTYGNRFNLLEQVLNSCLQQNVFRIIVVDNNSQRQSQQKLKYFALRHSPQLKVIYLPNNSGSANGYKVGLQKALTDKNTEFIWLLDDDNKPQTGALTALYAQWQKLNISAKNQHLALLATRHNQRDIQKLIAGYSSKYVYPIKNGFLGFNIFSYPYKIWEKLKRLLFGQQKATELMVPYAPYGGFFFHKDLLKNIGLPETKFYLYGDDHEFSYRLTKKGGQIYLVLNSRIADLEKSWHLQKKISIFDNLLNGEKFRVYYYIRNRIYFEKKDLVQNSLPYLVNKFVFIFILFLKLFRQHKLTRWKLLHQAMVDGYQGKLGQGEHY